MQKHEAAYITCSLPTREYAGFIMVSNVETVLHTDTI